MKTDRFWPDSEKNGRENRDKNEGMGIAGN